MVKIAIDARFYGTEHTGLGRYTTNVLTHLPNYLRGDSLQVLLRRKYYDSLKLPANCHKVLAEIPHYSLSEQLALPLLLRRLAPDLLYTFHFNAPILSRIPSVITLHDLIKTYFTGAETTTRSPWLYQLKRAGYNLVLGQTLSRARAVIVPSNTVKNQILSVFPTLKPERIHPIPEAPDPAFTLKPKIINLKSEMNLPSKFILFVGNAYPHKNLSVLLQAFRALKDPELHLIIVAKRTPFLARVLAPFEQTRMMVLSDLTDSELTQVYRQAQALVTPSLMEGYGLVGLEALAVGTPVLASDIPVYREVYGDRVTYFDPHSSHDLATKITQILSSSINHHVLPKLARAKEDYSITQLPILKRTWDDVARTIAEVLHAPSLRL